MKKYIFIFFLLLTSFVHPQMNNDSNSVWISFFEDSIKVQPYLSINPEKYIFTMTFILNNIEKEGQSYLDWLGKERMWFVPKSLSEQVEAICNKHKLVVRYKREGY